MRGTNHDDLPPRQSPPAAPFFVVVFINGPDQPKDPIASLKASHDYLVQLTF